MSVGILAGATWGGALTGRILDAATSEPIPGALVRLEEKGNRGGEPRRDSLLTGADGSYAFRDLPALTGAGFGYIVIARKEDYRLGVQGPIPLQAGEDRNLDIPLTRNLAVEVRVREGGATGGPLAGASLVIVRAGQERPALQTLSDSTGGSRVGPFEAGEYGFTVAKAGFRTRIVKVTLEGLAWVDTLEVALERDAPAESKSLHGRVTDPAGRPLAAPFHFSCVAPEGTAWLSAGSAEDGRYRLEGIPAGCDGGKVRFQRGDPTETILVGPETELNLVTDAVSLSVRRKPAVRPAAAASRGRDVLGRRLRSSTRLPAR